MANDDMVKLAAPAANGWNVIEHGAPGPVGLSSIQRQQVGSELKKANQVAPLLEQVERLRTALKKCINPDYHGVDCQPMSDEDVEALGPEYEGAWDCECHIEEAAKALEKESV